MRTNSQRAVITLAIGWMLFLPGGLKMVAFGETPPAAPQNVHLVNWETKTMGWDPVIGATSYNIYCARNSNVSVNSPRNGTSTQTQYAASIMVATSTYWCIVTAVNLAGESPPSQNPIPLITGPMIEINLRVTSDGNFGVATNNGSATLTWTHLAGAVSYNIYMLPPTGSPQEFQYPFGQGVTNIRGGSPSYSYQKTGLTNSRTYYFFVTAMMIGNNETMPMMAFLTTPAAPMALTAPLGLTAARYGNTGPQIRVSWPAVPQASSYWVYWTQGNVLPSTSSPNRISVPSSTAFHPPTEYQAPIQNVAWSTTYNYILTAVNSAGTQSAPSARVTVAMPASPGDAPRLLSAEPLDSSVAVSFFRDSTTPNSFNIYWSTNPTGLSPTNNSGSVTISSTATFVTGIVPGLTNGRRYWFIAVTNYPGGPGLQSATVMAIPGTNINEFLRYRVFTQSFNTNSRRHIGNITTGVLPGFTEEGAWLVYKETARIRNASPLIWVNVCWEGHPDNKFLSIGSCPLGSILNRRAGSISSGPFNNSQHIYACKNGAVNPPDYWVGTSTCSDVVAGAQNLAEGYALPYSFANFQPFTNLPMPAVSHPRICIWQRGGTDLFGNSLDSRTLESCERLIMGYQRIRAGNVLGYVPSVVNLPFAIIPALIDTVLGEREISEGKALIIATDDFSTFDFSSLSPLGSHVVINYIGHGGVYTADELPRKAMRYFRGLRKVTFQDWGCNSFRPGIRTDFPRWMCRQPYGLKQNQIAEFLGNPYVNSVNILQIGSAVQVQRVEVNSCP